MISKQKVSPVTVWIFIFSVFDFIALVWRTSAHLWWFRDQQLGPTSPSEKRPRSQWGRCDGRQLPLGFLTDRIWRRSRGEEGVGLGNLRITSLSQMWSFQVVRGFMLLMSSPHDWQLTLTHNILLLWLHPIFRQAATPPPFSLSPPSPTALWPPICTVRSSLTSP